jgi:triphosphoribosyl-dephospho-CoA synthase
LLSARVVSASRSPASSDLIGQDALDALACELELFPKPGLVSPIDSGAHDDMDVETFRRSLVALADYFPAIAAAGAIGADFVALQQLGLRAEAKMLVATGGINTHRGAIFSLGLLAAAAAHLTASGQTLAGDTIGQTIRRLWAPEIARAVPRLPSHGELAVRRFDVKGARQEAADGFPLLFDVALPAFRRIYAVCNDVTAARIQTLFVLMAQMDDTNLLHRGGLAGLAFVKEQAGSFLSDGGVLADGWHERVRILHKAFVARRLSPGGAADMLACTCFILQLQDRFA